MASSSHAAVTPDGIRDGDPAALAALVERRGNAVLAYCEAVCPPASAERAAAEAFARFRSVVANAADPRVLDPDALLLTTTRHAAASLTPVPTPAPSLRNRLGVRGASPETCALVPGLLAARAEGELSAPDRERLAKHLERDASCRRLADAVERAERAYTSPPARTVPIGALTEIMLALAGAAPNIAQQNTFEFGEIVLPEDPFEAASPDASSPGPAEAAPAAASPEPAATAPSAAAPAVASPEPAELKLPAAALPQPAAPKPSAPAAASPQRAAPTPSAPAPAVASPGPIEPSTAPAGSSPQAEATAPARAAAPPERDPAPEDTGGARPEPATPVKRLTGRLAALRAAKPAASPGRERAPVPAIAQATAVADVPPATGVDPAPAPRETHSAGEALEDHTIVPVGTDEEHTLVLPAAALATTGRGVAHPRPERRAALHLPGGDHGVVYRYVLPGALIVVFGVVAMGVSGVFASDDPPPTPTAPTVSSSVPAPPVNAPPVSTEEGATNDAAALAAARKASRERAAAERRREAQKTTSTPAATVPADTTTTTTEPAPTPTPTTPAPAKKQAKPPADDDTGTVEPESDSSALPQTDPAPAAGDPGVFQGDAPSGTTP